MKEINCKFLQLLSFTEQKKKKSFENRFSVNFLLFCQFYQISSTVRNISKNALPNTLIISNWPLTTIHDVANNSFTQNCIQTKNKNK